MDSKAHTFTYTPEYYAVKHYSHFIVGDTEIVAYKGQEKDRLPILIVKTETKKYVVMTGNFNADNRKVTMRVNGKCLNVTLPGHSLNTFVMK